MLHIYQIIIGFALLLKRVQVKAPITLQEKLLIVYALRFIKVFVVKVGLHFNAQKKFDGKNHVALFLLQKFIAKVALRCNTLKNQITLVAFQSQVSTNSLITKLTFSLTS